MNSKTHGGYTNGVKLLYVSENFLVVNKPADLKINSDDDAETTLATILSNQFPEKVDDSVGHKFRFVHRLDYSTSGCICIALNKTSAEQASKLFSNRLAVKHYLALVRGLIKEEKILIDVGIGEDASKEESHKMCTEFSPHCRRPRKAATTLLKLEHGRYEGHPATKVLLLPHTGRRHQLRVHCHHIGHTVVGDYTYSGGTDSQTPRMMLHAYQLVLPGVAAACAPDPFVDISDWELDVVFRSSDEELSSCALKDGLVL